MRAGETTESFHISQRGGGGVQSGRHRRSGDPSRRGAEGELELIEGATAKSRLKKFQKGSAGTRPNGSLREVRERLSPTPARLEMNGSFTQPVFCIAVRSVSAHRDERS